MPKLMYPLSTGEVTSVTGVTKKTLERITRDGYYILERTVNGEVVSKRVNVPFKTFGRGKHRRYPKRSVDALLQGVEPNRRGWVTVRRLVEKYSLEHARITKAYRDGRIGGMKSLIEERLHLYPSAVKLLLLDLFYSVPVSYKRVGLSDKSMVFKLNKMAPKPFLTGGPGRGRVMPPSIRGRLRRLLAMDRGTLQERMQHLYDNNFVLNLYIEGIDADEFNSYHKGDMLYNPDKPPAAKKCRVNGWLFYEGIGRGRIVATGGDEYRPMVRVYFPVKNKAMTFALGKG